MAKKVFKLPPSMKTDDKGKIFVAPVLVPVQPKPDWNSGSKGAEVYYEMSGLSSLLQTLDLIPEIYKDAAGVEVQNFLKEVKEGSQAICPFDTGALYDSADCDAYDPEKGTNIINMSVWYAGPDFPDRIVEGGKIQNPKNYALEQHENLHYHHDIGGPKYLERAWLARTNSIFIRIGNAVTQARGIGIETTYMGFQFI